MPGTILFITKSRDDSATRYRAAVLFGELKNRGWRIIHVPGDEAGFRLRALVGAWSADVLFVQRRFIREPVWTLLRLLCPRVVFDFDDAIFLKSSGKATKGRTRRFRRMVRGSRLVLVGNEYLAAEARRFNPQVRAFPTSIETGRYPENHGPAPGAPELVWIGSRSTSKYLRAMPEIFQALHEELPAVRLKVIADFAWEDALLPCVNVGWSADTEITELQSARIGIAPMPDDPWTRGKCALKVLQYMAAGLPVVSSDCGANAEVVEPGVTGLLAGSPAEWVQAVRQLLGDEELRRRMGEAGRQRVMEFYAQERIVNATVDALESLGRT